MDTAPLKSYAPAARREFLQAVADRAAHYGLTAKKIEPVTVQGDVALIAGEAFPARIAPLRKRAVRQVSDGFLRGSRRRGLQGPGRGVAAAYSTPANHG